MLNLIGYSRWPAADNSAEKAVQLCVDKAVERVAARLQGQMAANGRMIDTRVIDAMETASVAQCDAVYLRDVADGRRKTLVAELIGKPVLIIVEQDQACEVGSMFCLGFREDHVSFRINLDSIARSGIRVHPGVLRLGRRPTEVR